MRLIKEKDLPDFETLYARDVLALPLVSSPRPLIALTAWKLLSISSFLSYQDGGPRVCERVKTGEIYCIFSHLFYNQTEIRKFLVNLRQLSARLNPLLSVLRIF